MGRADRQLRLIAEIVQVAAALRIEVWLRGGWAMDFFLGEVTRDHQDIDWFAWTADAGALAEGLLAHGCQPVPGPTPDLQLDFAKDGLDISLTLLGRDMAGRVVVAGGPWAGAPWPEGMLDAEPGRIGGLRDSTARPFANPLPDLRGIGGLRTGRRSPGRSPRRPRPQVGPLGSEV